MQAAEGPDMPPELLRRFEIVFKPLSKAKPVPMRQIGAEHVGKLVSVKVMLSPCIVADIIGGALTQTADICLHHRFAQPPP